MRITTINNLNQVQINQARALLKACWEYDGTAREPYLSNMLNFDPKMPSFVLAYEDSQLVGLLAAYADDQEPEISIYVHPDKRRQGFAKKIYQVFREATKEYGLKTFCFVSETAFIGQNPNLIAHWDLKYSGDKEYLMQRTNRPFELFVCKERCFTLAKPHQIESIAKVQSLAFDNPMEESIRYAREAMADPNSLLYVATQNEEVLASCTVDISSSFDYLYGLAVKPDRQGEGIGSCLVKHLLNDRIQNGGITLFKLAVDHENLIARKLYEKLGFEVVTEIVYLDEVVEE